MKKQHSFLKKTVLPFNLIMSSMLPWRTGVVLTVTFGSAISAEVSVGLLLHETKRLNANKIKEVLSLIS
jgi:hypothetical protein